MILRRNRDLFNPLIFLAGELRKLEKWKYKIIKNNNNIIKF